jgi:hypothetical protein
MTWNTSALAKVNAYRCNTKLGLCQHTQCPHRILEGHAPGGIAWTKLAQAYPKRLCVRLAGMIDDAIDLRELAGLRF